MKEKFEVKQRVVLQNTSDVTLDGESGCIVCFTDHYKEYPIVLFDTAPEGYDPAIMISAYCLKRI